MTVRQSGNTICITVGSDKERELLQADLRRILEDQDYSHGNRFNYVITRIFLNQVLEL